MPYFNRTYRVMDGERIEGSWRQIFIKNGASYFLTDLKVYADGMIDCSDLVDLATFRQKVASGRVATPYLPGRAASPTLNCGASGGDAAARAGYVSAAS
jgi:hypothetical protein